jgi:hypothetical protein
MKARINSARANQNQMSSAIRDSVSLILFDHEVFNFTHVSIFKFGFILYLFTKIINNYRLLFHLNIET